MEFRLNLILKNYGNNSTPSVTFFCKNVEEAKKMVENYKPVLRDWELYKYEHEFYDNIFITKRTTCKDLDTLILLPEQ